jgi:hypothetical protein
VGYFNSSVVGYNEEGVGLHACQKSSGVPENKLTQDVKTRWRSTHGMTDSLRVNQEPLLLYGNKERPGAGITLCTGHGTMLLFCTKGGRNKWGQRPKKHGSRSVPRTGQIRINT